MGLRALDNEDMARQSQVLLATVTRRAAAIARVLARIGVERRTTTGRLRVLSLDDAVLLLRIRGRARYAQAHVPK